MAQIKFDQVKAFLAVVRFGSVRGAAEALNLTQPAVTTRIKGLEHALGATLFDRTGSGMQLTRRGDLFVEYANQFQHLAELVEENVMDPDGVEARLRLGVSETIAQSWLPDFVARMHSLYPRVRIEISVDISSNLREQLLRREIDLAILLGPVSEYTVDNITLPDVPLTWFRAAGRTDEIDLASTPVITYARHTRPFRELKNALFRRYGPQVSIFPSSSLSSCFRLVEVGLGVGVLPVKLGAELVESGRITTFDPGWTPAPLHFTASYLGEPKSHMIETVARLARDVADDY